MAQKRAKCGTRSGYARHKRRGESPCADCLRAEREYSRARRRAKDTGRPVDEFLPPELVPKQRRKQAVTPEPEPDVAVSATVVAPVAEFAAAGTVPAGDAEVLSEPPAYLKARGRGLWTAVTSAYALNPAGMVLLAEACRTADRLERLAAALASRSTLWFEVGDIEQADEAGVPIVVNGMLGEARAMQASLRQTLKALGVVDVSADDDGAPTIADQLAARRAARLAAAGGELSR